VIKLGADDFVALHRIARDDAFDFVPSSVSRSALLPRGHRRQAAEGVGEWDLPRWRSSTREKWQRIAKLAARGLNDLGFVEVIGGTRGLAVDLGMPETSGARLGKNLEAWAEEGIVRLFHQQYIYENPRNTRRGLPALVGIQIPWLTSALVWAANRNAERLDGVQDPISHAQVALLLSLAAKHRAHLDAQTHGWASVEIDRLKQLG
jgi:hypothetical protein